MSTHFCQANVVWDKEINQFRTSVAVELNDNLYNTTLQPRQSTLVSAEARINTLRLFDGYGLYLPASISSRQVSYDSELNNHDVVFEPQLHVFLSENTEIDFIIRHHDLLKINGDSQAEFLTSRFLDETFNSAQLSLSLGRAQQLQFLNFDLGQSTRKQTQSNGIFTDIQTNYINSLYGHQLTEDTDWLLHGTYQNEQRLALSSMLYEMGLGFQTDFGSTHQFKLVTGWFERSGDSKSKGFYWQLEDNWQITELHQLRFLTSQRSEVATSVKALTQLRTRAEVFYQLAISQQHSLNATINYQTIELDNTSRMNRSWQWQLRWQWQILQDIIAKLSFNQLKTKDNYLLADTVQNRWDLNLEYVW